MITKKIIGRVPVCFGSWYPKQGGWGIKNRVTLYGSEFESLHDNNIVPPATYDETTQTVTFNESDWRVISNGTDAWLADTRIEELGTWKENEEFLRLYTDLEDHFLFGIRNDGSVDWGKGVPEPIRKEINAILEKIDESFTLRVEELEEKLNDLGYYINNNEWIRLYLDEDEHVLFGIRIDGSIDWGKGIPLPILDALLKLRRYVDDSISNLDSIFSSMFEIVSSPEYIYAVLDLEGHFLFGVDTSGKFKASNIDLDLPENIVAWLKDVFSEFNDPEGNMEATLDESGKLLSWRDKDGIKHEQSVKVEKSLDLSSDAMTNFQQALKDAGFQPGGGGDFSERKNIEVPEPQSYALLNLIINKLPTTDSETQKGLVEYYDKSGNYFKISCSIEVLGQTSSVFAKTGGKGNYTLDLEEDVKFGSWVPQDSFHLKGAAKDVVRGILPTSYKWAYMMLEYINSRPNRVLIDESEITLLHATGTRMNDWPSDARCLPDGFPVEIYINDEYWGLGALLLKKHRKNYSMDKKDYKSFFIDADKIMSDDYTRGLWNDGPDAINPDNGVSKWWNGFDIKGPKDLICMDGSEFDGDAPKELIDSTSQVYDASNKKHKGSALTKSIIREFSTKYNEVKDLIDASDTEQAKAKFEEYFDKDACILVYVFNCLMKNGDSVKKNTLWGTYNDGKIFPMLWDLDGMYGEGWTGTGASQPSYTLWEGAYAAAEWPLKLLWILYSNEIKATYTNLRQNNIISINTWKDIVFNQWVNRIGEEAYNRDIKKWPETPSYRKDYTNTEYWSYYTTAYSIGSYNLWSENENYETGNLVAMRLHPLSAHYYIYKAIKASNSENPQCPVTQFYELFPQLGGFYDSPKRWEKWMQKQIALCDAINEYETSNLSADFTIYRNTDSAYTINCSSMNVKNTNAICTGKYIFIEGHIIRQEVIVDNLAVSTYMIINGKETDEDTTKTYTTVRAAIEDVAEQPVDIPSENTYYIKARAKNVDFYNKI